MKCKIGFAVYSISMLMGAFYFASYYISNQMVKDFQFSFKDYRIFNDRLPCISDTFFYLQESIINNETLGDSTEEGK